jgi:ATP-dependent RNA helicase DeaD
MTDPVEMTVGTKNTGNENIEHEYYIVRAADKFAAFKRIVDFNPDIFGIVFCRTKIETQDIAEALIKAGYNANALHGDLSQQQRDKVMKSFRDRTLQMLIATDVAARGIDVDDVTHVINYSLPDEIENYTHRSGRTARAGKKGISISIINMKEIGKIRRMEKIIGKSFVKCEVPSGFDVCEKQLFGMVHNVQNVSVKEEHIAPYLPRIMEEFDALNKEDIIKRFVSLEFDRFLDSYKGAKDLNVDASSARLDSRGERGERRERRGDSGAEPGYTRLFVNVGSVDDFTRGDLLGYICETTQISGKSVGKIDLKGVFSFFEVEDSVLEQVQAGFKTAQYNNREVRIENAGARTGGSGRSGDRRSSRPRTSSGGGFRGERSSGNSYGGGGRRERSSSTSGNREGQRSGSGFRDFSGRSRDEAKKRW